MKGYRIYRCLLCFTLLAGVGVIGGMLCPEDYSMTAGIAEAGETDGGPAFFHSLTLSPAKVAVGDVVQVAATFSVSDNGSGDTVPVEYFYEIQKRGMTLLTSPTKRIDAGNGAKTVLGIQLEAAGGLGDYKMILRLTHPEGTSRGDMEFSIVSVEEARAYAYRTGQTREAPESLSFRSRDDERLPGKWRFVSPGPGASGRELVIGTENGKLVVRMTGGDTPAQWSTLKRDKNRLVLRSKYENTTGDCWYEMEDVVTLNTRMNNMPVRSEIVAGGTCVSVGRVSKSMLCRVK